VVARILKRDGDHARSRDISKKAMQILSPLHAELAGTKPKSGDKRHVQMVRLEPVTKMLDLTSSRARSAKRWNIDDRLLKPQGARLTGCGGYRLRDRIGRYS
jgi:hypothetical protein